MYLPKLLEGLCILRLTISILVFIIALVMNINASTHRKQDYCSPEYLEKIRREHRPLLERGAGRQAVRAQESTIRDLSYGDNGCLFGSPRYSAEP